MEGASGLESGCVGAFSTEGFSALHCRFRESGNVWCSVTGSVGARIVWLLQRDKTPTQKLTPPKKNRGGLTLLR